jgi:hypothetical protein
MFRLFPFALRGDSIAKKKPNGLNRNGLRLPKQLLLSVTEKAGAARA